MKKSKRRIYHRAGTCMECLWGPRYNFVVCGLPTCSEHKITIDDPTTHRCNQFYRGDFAKNKGK